MRRVCLPTLFFALFCLMSHPLFSQEDFYIDDGGANLRHVNAYANEIGAKVWLFRLYKGGEPTGGKNFWGVVVGNSIEDVQKRLETSQEFELNYNSFMGKGRTQDKTYTHFNALGPIARMDDNNYDTDKQKAGTTLEHIFGSSKSYLKSYFEIDRKVKEVLNGRTLSPYNDFGRTFKEYTKNVKDVLEQVSNLKNMLLSNQLSDHVAMDKWDEIKAEWANTEQSKNQMLDAIANYKPAANAEKHSGGNYVCFTFMNHVSTGSGTKLVYYFSPPVWYNGDKEAFRQSFMTKVLPQYVQNIPTQLRNGVQGLIFEDVRTRDFIKTEEQCARVIQETKRMLTSGDGTIGGEKVEVMGY